MTPLLARNVNIASVTSMSPFKLASPPFPSIKSSMMASRSGPEGIELVLSGGGGALGGCGGKEVEGTVDILIMHNLIMHRLRWLPMLCIMRILTCFAFASAGF